MKELEEKAKLLMNRMKDLQKYDLIKLVYENNKSDPAVKEILLDFIGAVLTDDVSKIRKAISGLKVEKLMLELPYFKLERFKK